VRQAHFQRVDIPGCYFHESSEGGARPPLLRICRETVVFPDALTGYKHAVCTTAKICRKYNVDVVELLLDKKNTFLVLAKLPDL
jgi:hypothetical protein